MLLVLYYLGIIISTVSALENNTTTQPVPKQKETFSKEILSANDDHTILAYVNFECKGKQKGYYADKEFECIVFHFCDDLNKRYSYKCKDGNRFDQVTSSCKNFNAKECNPRTSERASERSILTTSKRDNLIEKNSYTKLENADDDLLALSAFASLSQSGEHRTSRHDDSSFSSSNKVAKKILPPTNTLKKKSGRKQDITHPLPPNSYSVYDLTFPSRFPPTYNAIRRSDNMESANEKSEVRALPSTEKSEVRALPSTDQRFYDNYYPYGTSDGPSNPTSFLTTPFPIFQPNPHARNGFDPHPHKIDNSKHHNERFPQFFENHNQGNSFNHFPKSHYNFSPPGTTMTVKHPHIKTPFGNEIHAPHSNNNYKSNILIKPKPPSIFGSPSPAPIILNSPSPAHAFRNHPTIFEEFHKNPFGNVPHNPTQYFANIHQYSHIPNSQNYHLYDNVPHSYGPHLGISHISHANGISHPEIGVTNEYYHPVNLPIKTSHKTVKIPKTKLKEIDIEHDLISNIPHHIPVSEEILTEKYPAVNIHEQLENVKDIEPIKLKKKLPSLSNRGQVSNKLAANRNRSRKKIINTIAKPVVRDDSEDIIDKEIVIETPILTTPVEQLPVTDIPSRGLRRKIQRNNIKITSRKEEQQDPLPPANPIEEIKESHVSDYEELETIEPEKHEPEIHEPDIPQTTTAKPTIKPIKPPVLRGNLKDRLNRLGTRRRTLNQGRLKTQNNDHIEEISTSLSNDDPGAENIPVKVPRTRKLPTIKKEEAPIEEVTSSVTSEPKNRISNFFKERSQARRRPVRPLQKRVEEVKIVKKEDITNQDESEIINSDLNNAEQQTLTKEEISESTDPENDENKSTTQRKRKMNPDVRARFKEFLKNRKSRLKGNTDNDATSQKETEEPENNENATQNLPENHLVNEEVLPEEALPEESIPEERQKESLTDEIQLKESLPKDVLTSEKNLKNESIPEEILHKETEGRTLNEENNTNLSEGEMETEHTSEDITAHESRTMEKSVPLVRKEKVILLDDPYEYPFEGRQKRLSYGVINSNPTIPYDIHSILSHPSAKPFRYMLNKTKYKKLILNQDQQHLQPQDQQIQDQQEQHFDQEEHVKFDITTIKPLFDNNHYRDKIFSTQTTSITKHKVVSPSNFKQIVRMHPRNPTSHNSLPANGHKSNKDTKIEENNSHYKDTTYNVYNIDITAAPGNRNFDENSKPILATELLYEQKDLQGDDIEFSSDNEEVDETIRVSKPVFNLDSIFRINTDDNKSHISALDTKDYKEKLSSIQYEPFSLSNDEHMLPIEKLLKLTSS